MITAVKIALMILLPLAWGFGSDRVFHLIGSARRRRRARREGDSA